VFHVIGEQKLKVYFFNYLERGKIELPFQLKMKNVNYIFDNSLNLKEILVVNEPAYVLTKDGFVEWKPPYVFVVFNNTTAKLHLVFPKYSYIDQSNFVPFYYRNKKMYIYYNYVDEIEPVCLSYICYDFPKNPIQLTKDNFKVIDATPLAPWRSEKSKTINIYENDEGLVFEAVEGEAHFLVNILLGQKLYNILYTFPGSKLVIGRGTCFLIRKDNLTICY
jgi:hypothetical protein